MDLAEVERTMRAPRFARDLKRYQHLVLNLHKVDVSKCVVFQKTYNGFFQVRRCREKWLPKHYEYLEKNKTNSSITFSEILKALSSMGKGVEASFASKMLSIINPEMPVLDSKVLDKLSLKLPKRDSSTRFEEILVVYEKICAWYKDFFKRPESKAWIDLFDKHYPNSGINPVKKVDFVLWQMK